MDEEKKEHEHMHEHEHEHKEYEHMPEHSHKKNMTENVRRNPWMLATFICGILIVILLISMFSGSDTGGVISANEAGTKVVTFLNQYLTTDNGSTLGSVNDTTEIGVYTVNVNYKNSTIPIYLSYNGQYIDWGGGMININSYAKYVSSQSQTSSTSSNTQTAAIPKTDKPVVDLYVFAYCPYGLQTEKAILPVISLLGSDINFSIRYIGEMHDPQGCTGSNCFETTETQRQLCIEKNYPSEYLNYISAFATNSGIGNCEGSSTNAACVEPLIQAIYSQLGINETTINSCMSSEGTSLFNAEAQNAQSVGVTGSPTMIINGVQASIDTRSPEAIKGVICSAFNTVPSACSTTLDTNQASYGFGGGSSSSSSTGTQCGTA